MPQDTPSTPPRQKGPLVWLDMDQKELDDAYDQAVYAPNAPHVHRRREVINEKAKKALGEPKRLKYGAPDIEGLDLYQAKGATNAPVAVYIHGGAWRNGVSANFGQTAEMLNAAGVHYLAADFNNIDSVGGSLFPMVDQVRRAVAWVSKNAREFGGDPSRLYVLGHSSGGHLSGCVCVTDWTEYGLPATGVIKGAVLCSGMYDLTPVRLSKRSKYVNFTDEMVEKLSSIRHIHRITFPLVVGYGTCETPEFQRQGREFSAALTKAGKPHELIVGEGYNHFEMFETFFNPYGLIGREILKLMGLGKG